MKAYFDVLELYYLPQYIPVAKALENHGVECVYVFYGVEGSALNQSKVIADEGLDVCWVKDKQGALDLYLEDKPSWLFIGNSFDGLYKVHEHTKSALLSHGIGPKSCYYTVSESKPTVRFVEGPYRKGRLEGMYPNQTFVDTGYAKLDPVVNGDLSVLKPSDFGLDNRKKTILYAPTFYPSSIECFSKSFPSDFSDYNIILKPHYFSLVSDKYAGQKKRLEHWSKSKNVYLAGVEEVNILPFMAVSDLLISDASSTLFEFAALDKPVVWCDFFKLRWGYRGIFRYRFEKRMDKDLYEYADIAVHADKYKNLLSVVDHQMNNPADKQVERNRYTLDLAGVVDGCVAKRIAEYVVGVVGDA